MKVLIIFLSLVVMGCVTANTRDLSAINPEAESARQTTLKVADYATCKQSCKEDGYGDSFCSCACSADDCAVGGSDPYSKIDQPLKVADYATCMEVCVRGGHDREDCNRVCWRE